LEVGTWLSSLGLERYEQAFRENDIVAEVLPRLTTEDLIAIGVTSVGHRRMLLDAIAVLASTSKPVEAAFTFGTLSFLPYVGKFRLSLWIRHQR
jgi:hypothetical protein